ncbi:Fc.00g091920.m01.CDS01 [Cosmosporella sp. VM-42]
MPSSPRDSLGGQKSEQENGTTGKKRRHEESVLEDSFRGISIPPPSSRERFIGSPGEDSYPDPPPETATTETAGRHTLDSTVVIYVGKKRMRIPQSNFLRLVWTHGLDSRCEVCNKDFTATGPPPIRTLSFQLTHTLDSSSGDITCEPIAPYPLRVRNRHFECIKRKKIKYFPISHAWHSSVSSAQEAGTETLEATRLAYQVPVKTLWSIYRKSGSVEIWHDYLSVPQWFPDFQQALLLAIPEIYAYPSGIMIHLDDIRGVQLNMLHRNATYRTFLEGLASLSQSRWFSRMWVALEYLQGQDVSIISEDFEIMPFFAAELNDVVDENMGKYQAHNGQDKFGRDSKARGHEYSRTASWTDMETWKSEEKFRTFGTAIHILAERHCRDARDYVFAISGLLGLTRTGNETDNALSGNTFPLYLTTARYALERGDYTPLLLTPPRGEVADERATWLHGHSKRSDIVWDLGMCHEPARYQSIIQEGKICPALEHVGIIEEFEYSDFNYQDRTAMFLGVAQKIFKCSGTSPQQFCSAIDRIFPLCANKALYSHWNITTIQAKEMVEYDYGRVADLIKHMDLQAEDVSIDNVRRASAATDELTKLLGVQGPQKLTGTCRLKEAYNEAYWYKCRGYDQMEALARVRCSFCGRRSLFRLSMWEAPIREEAQVFRIPGLLYDLTIPGGIGMVISGKKIIGRMSYGTPACDCHQIKEVEIQ